MKNFDRPPINIHCYTLYTSAVSLYYAYIDDRQHLHIVSRHDILKHTDI